MVDEIYGLLSQHDATAGGPSESFRFRSGDVDLDLELSKAFLERVRRAYRAVVLVETGRIDEEKLRPMLVPDGDFYGRWPIETDGTNRERRNLARGITNLAWLRSDLERRGDSFSLARRELLLACDATVRFVEHAMRLVATRVAALEQPEDAAIAGLGDQGQGRAARAELTLFRDTGLLRSILDRRRFGITGGDESIWLHVDAAQLLSSSSDMASAPDCIKVVDDRAYRSTESTMLGNLACLCGIWKAAKQCPPKSGESDGLREALDADDANAVTGWLRELSKGLEDAGRWLDEEVWQSTGTVPREQIIEAFEEFLNLPLWRHRWLLYEIWILAASIQAAISQGWVCQLHLEREAQIPGYCRWGRRSRPARLCICPGSPTRRSTRGTRIGALAMVST